MQIAHFILKFDGSSDGAMALALRLRDVPRVIQIFLIHWVIGMMCVHKSDKQ